MRTTDPPPAPAPARDGKPAARPTAVNDRLSAQAKEPAGSPPKIAATTAAAAPATVTDAEPGLARESTTDGKPSGGDTVGARLRSAQAAYSEFLKDARNDPESRRSARDHLAKLEATAISVGFRGPDNLNPVRAEIALLTRLDRKDAPTLYEGRKLAGVIAAARTGLQLNAQSIDVLDDDLVLAFNDTSVPLTDATLLGLLKDDAREGDSTPWASGGNNTVHAAKYRLDGPDSTPTAVVFKREAARPERADHRFSPAAWTAGIRVKRDDWGPNWAGRSVATFRLDKKLGLGVTPRTEFAIHHGELGTVMERVAGISPLTTGKLTHPAPGAVADYLREHPDVLKNFAKGAGFISGVVTDQGSIELDPGGPKIDSGVLIRRDPVLRRELTKLQWLDALTGQVDRHAHNYVVRMTDTGRVAGVKGIDNDMAFGKNIEHVDDMAVARDFGYHGARLPSVIDAASRRAFLELTPTALEAELTGLLERDEIERTKSRLAEIQGVLMNDLVMVLGDDEWLSDGASAALGIDILENTTLPQLRDGFKLARDTSYCARDESLLLLRLGERLRRQPPGGIGTAVFQIPALLHSVADAKRKSGELKR